VPWLSTTALDGGILVLDGAMGSELTARGIAPDFAVLDAPDAVAAIHRDYAAAGARAIYTNTFGANRARLAVWGAEERVHELNAVAVGLARSAAGGDALVVGCLGPTGRRLGADVSFDEAVAIFAEQARALLDAGVDALAIETMLDLEELRAAVVAAGGLRRDEPVFACASVFADGRSLAGEPVEEVASRLAALGADVVGANCCEGPESLLPLVAALARATSTPILAKPSAGLPVEREGALTYPFGPDEMASGAERLIRAGARLVGGCCGTTPETIRAIARIPEVQAHWGRARLDGRDGRAHDGETT
jgi:5-methyltetrahydrofolate--homocysteine methyltransferase